MTSSALLIVFGTVLLTVLVLFLPKHGLIRQLFQWRQYQDRVLIEDALKHLHDYEYRGRWATVESLAGSLALSAARSTRLLTDLERLGLIESASGGPRLTPSGRRDALKVIRIHRLWEQYLSEQTGLSESYWHPEADRREHQLSPGEVQDLATRLGEPRYDPHGDPIPTADGTIPSERGGPLSSLKAGETASIVHIEDEPAALYAQILALRLTRGMVVEVVEASNERIVFDLDGEEHVLAPVVAANISVVKLPAERAPRIEKDRLSSLHVGESAKVVALSPACRGMQRRRLLDLGLVPDTIVRAELQSPGGDPTAYRIRGALIALRRDQADLIHVGDKTNGA